MPNPQPPRFTRADAKTAHKIATGPLLGPVSPSDRPAPAEPAPASEQARVAPLGSFLDVRARLAGQETP